MKICTRCKIKKLKNEFHKSKTGRYGIRSYCKECSSIIKQEEKKFKCIICGIPISKGKYCEKEYQKNYKIKKYFKLSKDGVELKRCSACKKFKPMDTDNFYPNRSIKLLTGLSSHCIECARKKAKAYNKTNRAKLLRNKRRAQPDSADKRYKKSAKYKQKRNKEYNLRRKTDISFNLTCRMKSLMHSSLRSTKNGSKWQDLAGYSVDKLKRHLEKQFIAGMTWERFLNGEIHIDHKTPVSVFNFSSPDDTDFKRCYALKNLQPMWAIENLKKGNNLEKHFQPTLF